VTRRRSPAAAESASPPAETRATAAAGRGGAAPDGLLILILHADGASRGNPGPSGAGAVLTTASGEVVAELRRFLGRATNNVAEYEALILGLETAKRHGAGAVIARMDSELVVRQVNGSYQVKNLALKRLHARVIVLARGFPRFTIEHVPRAANAVADRLANEAIDGLDDPSES
jgi:ribonuclease HI